MKHLTALYVAAAMLIGLLPMSADAGEGVRPAGPIGGTDIRQAWLPPPGVYGGGVGIKGWFPTYYSSDDKLDANGDFLVGGIGLLGVYPVKLFGGQLASSVFISGGETCFGVDPGSPVCSNGLGDTYSDVLMWSRYFPSGVPEAQQDPFIPYGLQVLVGLGASLPTGVYDASQPVNNGTNVYDIAPNFALTYTAPSIFGPAFGDATEFSGRFFYNFYTKNDATDFDSGDLLSSDFAISQRAGPWQFGVAGTAFVQIEDDVIGGVTPPGGNRAKSLQLGPVLSYDFMTGDRPWNFTVKGLASVAGENTTGPTVIIVRIGTKLF